MSNMNNASLSGYYEILRKNGGRITPVMSTILQQLSQSQKIHSPMQLKDAINQVLVNDIGLPTIYRTLDRLMIVGLVQRMYRDDGQTFFYICRHPQDHHHHFICTDCQCVQEVDICLAKQYENHLSNQFGLMVTRHIIQFEGICKDCQKKQN